MSPQKSQPSYTFEETADTDLVRSILLHPRIWRTLGPYASTESPRYILLRDGAEILGFTLIAPQNHICWEIHASILPLAWGDRGQEAIRQFFRWVWENTPCRRLVTAVAEFNRLAVANARRVGMVEYGRNPRSVLKGGMLQDQILFGIDRPQESRLCS